MKNLKSYRKILLIILWMVFIAPAYIALSIALFPFDIITDMVMRLTE